MTRSNWSSFSTNNSRVGKAISDSSSIGVTSCLSGGRRMVKCTRSTDGSAFSRLRHTRSPACGSPETSSTRNRSRTPRHRHDGAVVLQRQFGRAGLRLQLDDVLAAMRDRHMDRRVLADRHGLRCPHRVPSMRTATSAVPPARRRNRRPAGRCRAFWPTMAKRAALTMVSLRSRSSLRARRSAHAAARAWRACLRRRVMHFAVGDQDRAGDALRRHIGERGIERRRRAACRCPRRSSWS